MAGHEELFEVLVTQEDIQPLRDLAQVHSELISERAAGWPRLMQTRDLSDGLANSIEEVETSSTLDLTIEQSRVLDRARRLGDGALSGYTNAV